MQNKVEDKLDFWIMYLEGDLSLKELKKLLAGYC